MNSPYLSNPAKALSMHSGSEEIGLSSFLRANKPYLLDPQANT